MLSGRSTSPTAAWSRRGRSGGRCSASIVTRPPPRRRTARPPPTTRRFKRVAPGGRACKRRASGAVLRVSSATGHLLARQAYHRGVFFADPQLGPVKEAIDDVPGPLDAIIDQLRGAFPRGEEQRRRLTRGEGLGKLDEGFLAVIKDPRGRPAGMVRGVNAVAKVELRGITGEGCDRLLLLGLAGQTSAGEARQVIGGVLPGDRRHVRAGRAVALQMIHMPVG